MESILRCRLPTQPTFPLRFLPAGLAKILLVCQQKPHHAFQPIFQHVSQVIIRALIQWHSLHLSPQVTPQTCLRLFQAQIQALSQAIYQLIYHPKHRLLIPQAILHFTYQANHHTCQLLCQAINLPWTQAILPQSHHRDFQLKFQPQRLPVCHRTFPVLCQRVSQVIIPVLVQQVCLRYSQVLIQPCIRVL